MLPATRQQALSILVCACRRRRVGVRGKEESYKRREWGKEMVKEDRSVIEKKAGERAREELERQRQQKGEGTEGVEIERKDN